MASCHAWEVPDHTWDAPAIDGRVDVDSDGEAWEPSAEACGQEFFDMVVALKQKGALSAKQACCLAYFAAGAGCPGPISKLAVRPDRPTGHFSRHFDRALACDSGQANLYHFEVPGHNRAEAARASIEVAAIPLQEHLEAVARANPELLSNLQQKVESRSLPPCYFSHPVVQAARAADEQCLPLALYTDSTPFARQDSIVGVFAYDLVTNMRCLLTCLRKSELCKCGCGGWDSLFPVWLFAEWCLRSCASGRYPGKRHDGQTFTQGDAVRSSVAGMPLGFRAAVLFLKSDWSEWGSSFGFSSHATRSDPCALCTASADTMHDVVGYSALGMSSPAKDWSWYQSACASCEIVVSKVSSHARDRCLALLEADRRKEGARGYALREAVPELDLAKGDRLEPTAALVDSDKLSTTPCPATLVFWRRSCERGVRRRNPVFQEDLGTQPHRCLQVDWLHCLSLGVFGFYIVFVVQEMFAANPWNSPGTGEARKALNLLHLKADLFAWYGREEAAGRVHGSRVQGLTLGMFVGDCGLHGSEANAFLRFLVEYIQRFEAQVQRAREMIRGGIALLEILDVIKGYPELVPPAVVQEFVHNAKLHIQFCAAVGLPLRPKHHQLLEMGCRILEFGSPAMWGCWRDEAINNLLKATASSAHRAVWHKRVVSTFYEAHGPHKPAAAQKGFKRSRS